MSKKINPLQLAWTSLSVDRKDLSSLYLFASIAALVQLSLPLGFQAIINFLTFNTYATSVYILILAVCIGVLISGWMQIKQLQITETVQQKIFVRNAEKFTTHIPKIELKSSDGSYLPELANRFFETLNLQKGVVKVLLEVPVATVQIILGIILLALYHPVFLAIAILLIFIVYFIIRLSSEKGLQTSLQECDFKYSVAGWLQEISRNLNTFKNYNNISFHIEKSDHNTSEYLTYRTKHFQILQTQYWSMIIFKFLLIALFLIIGSVLLKNQQINIGQFVASEIVVFILIGSIEKLILSIDVFFDVITAAQKMNLILDKPEEKTGTLELSTQNALKVEFKNISFSYRDEELLLKNFSLLVSKGEKYLLVSKNSGSGISTIIKLLSGSHKPIAGEIFINDWPLQHYEMNSYRSKISYMIGTPELFDGSLEENIFVGRKHIGIQRLTTLLEELGLEDFIKSFPQGLESKIFTKGIKLPSHLIRKIILLRCLLEPGQLLLLDNPFRDLSDKTIHKLIQHFKSLDCTIIIGTHETIADHQFKQLDFDFKSH